VQLSHGGQAGRARGRLALLAVALACAAAGVLAQGNDAAGAGGGRPNVVVILTDDQDAASMHVMRKTRRLLIREGVKFSRHYATFPLCCPSRASYLTGQYAHNHGVRGNHLPDGGFLLFDDSATAATAMRARGYRTAWVGKFLNGYPNFARAHPGDIPAGFSRWFAGLTGRMFDWFANDEGDIKRIRKKARNYQTDVYTRVGERFIRRSVRVGDPFFLTLGPLAPHGEPKRDEFPNPRPAPRHQGAFKRAPLPKPSSFNEAKVRDKPSFIRQVGRLDREDRERIRDRYRSRLASLLAVDDMVGDIVKTLRERNALRDTYIIFTSDNGYMLGEHRQTGKSLLYEESARVPMIIRGPGVRNGAAHHEPTGNVDVMPTILDIGNASAGAQVDGVSLLRSARRPGRNTGRVILLENRRSAGVEDGRYVYIEHDLDDDGGTEEFELYDLRRDPRQNRNLHAVDAPEVRPGVLEQRPGLAGVRDSLADQLDDLRNCDGAACH
jgi:N-acetylglucosamine-6-sulfatase